MLTSILDVTGAANGFGHESFSSPVPSEDFSFVLLLGVIDRVRSIKASIGLDAGRLDSVYNHILLTATITATARPVTSACQASSLATSFLP